MACETDGREAYNDILHHEASKGRVHLHADVVNNIHVLLWKNWQPILVIAPREANDVANTLAGWGSSIPPTIQSWLIHPLGF